MDTKNYQDVLSLAESETQKQSFYDFGRSGQPR